MNIKQALFAYLNNLVDGRMYPGRLPQEPTYPAITYLRVSDNGIIAHDGAGDLNTARFQFDCHGTHAQADATATALQKTLNCFSGIMGGEGGVEIHGAFWKNTHDAFSGKTNIDKISIDFKILYKE